jgi:hypothetical protein
MAETLSSRGFEAEVFAGERGDAPRLARYDYLILCTEALGVTGRLPPRLSTLLAQSTGARGLRSMALVYRRAPFGRRALPRLMKAMEAEGMNVNYAEFVRGPAAAARAAAEAPVERRP